MSELPPNTPETIRAIRKRMGLTQSELAHLLGYQLRAWQLKEDRDPAKARKLMQGEFEYLLLLAGEHPVYHLAPNKKPT